MVGAVTLLGWVLDAGPLKSIIPGTVGMRPNTAICFVLAGLALLLPRAAGAAAALGVAVISALTLAEYLGVTVGIDQLLFRDTSPLDARSPGRMSVNGAVAFLLLAIALLLVRRGGRWALAAQASCLAAGTLAWLAVLGFATGVDQFRGPGFTPITLETSFGLIVVVVGVLALRPDVGAVRMMISSRAGGSLLRRLGPVVIVGLTVTGWAEHLAVANGLSSAEVAQMFFISATIVLLLTALGIAAGAAERLDRARLRTEAVTRESELLFRRLVEGATGTALIGFDVEGRVTHWNEGAEQVYGYTKSEILGASSSVLFPPEAQQQGEPAEELRAVRERGYEHKEAWRCRQDGTRFLAEISITAIYDESSTLVGFTKLTRDVTRRAEDEARIHALSAELDRFFTLSLELLCVAGTDGFLKRINPVWETTLGWTNEELKSRPFVDFVHPDDRERTITALQERTAGKPVIGFESRFRCKDGSHRWFEWSSTLALEGGLIYATGRDCTERKQAEFALQVLAAELEQRVEARTAALSASNEELEAFAYSVSHDLRGPLRGIDGFSQAVLEEYSDKLDEKGQDYLKRVRAGSQRMGILIDDLLSLSQVSRATLTDEHVDLSEIASSIAAELQALDTERSAEFSIEAGLTATGDRRLLRIALENLLGNAFKFTSGRATGHIEFAREQLDGRDAYFVRDDGAGFDMTYADQLFVPFQRLHTASEFPGTGIGLATVRRVVGRHGGRVWAHGEPDHGATIHFTLKGGK